MTQSTIIDMWKRGNNKITIAKRYKETYNKNVRKDGKKITDKEALAYVEPIIFEYQRKVMKGEV